MKPVFHPRGKNASASTLRFCGSDSSTECTDHDVSEVDDGPTITRRHVGYSIDEHLGEKDDDGVDQPGACIASVASHPDQSRPRQPHAWYPTSRLTWRIDPIRILVDPHTEPIDHLIRIVPPDLGDRDQTRAPAPPLLLPRFLSCRS